MPFGSSASQARISAATAYGMLYAPGRFLPGSLDNQITRILTEPLVSQWGPESNRLTALIERLGLRRSSRSSPLGDSPALPVNAASLGTLKNRHLPPPGSMRLLAGVLRSVESDYLKEESILQIHHPDVTLVLGDRQINPVTADSQRQRINPPRFVVVLNNESWCSSLGRYRPDSL